MKILLVGTFPEPAGGISIHLSRLACLLHARGIGCTVLDESRVLKPGLANLRRLSPWRYAAMLHAAELVHVHTSHPAARLLHVAAARLMRRKAVLTVHSLTAPGKSRLAHLLYRAAGALAERSIHVSEAVRRGAGGRGPVIAPFLPPSPQEESVPEDLLVFVAGHQRQGRRVFVSNASRLNRHAGEDLYGLDTVIEAMARPECAGLACVFAVSSPGHDRAYLEACRRRIAGLGLCERFLLLEGSVNFPGLVKIADGVIRATNIDGDALSVREGLWYGKPVVASDCAQRPAGVHLFRTRDAESLAAAMARGGVPSGPEQEQDHGERIIAVYRDVLAGQ